MDIYIDLSSVNLYTHALTSMTDERFDDIVISIRHKTCIGAFRCNF